MADLKFELVTPDRLVMSDDVYMVVVPGTEGESGILAGHAPYMTTLRDGDIAVYRAQEGQFPQSLNETIDLLSDVDLSDPYGGAPFVYRRTPSGDYLLYSVGENLRDDGGMAEDGSSSWDDITLEILPERGIEQPTEAP